jgi:D-tyrosyl-tRNA(Tyr) deacylase
VGRYFVVCVVSANIARYLSGYRLSVVLKAVLTKIVSQFTLLASLKKGNKPDFHQSASGEKAKALYDLFYQKVGELYDTQKVQNGVFGAMMDVSLVNDGPVCSRQN